MLQKEGTTDSSLLQSTTADRQIEINSCKMSSGHQLPSLQNGSHNIYSKLDGILQQLMNPHHSTMNKFTVLSILCQDH
jgi:hypothetical protein